MPSSQYHLFTEIGESILISLINPYKNVVRVLSFIDEVLGEESSSQLKKEFKWSVDNILYSDYIDLTFDNLQKLNLDPKNNFWISYKYTAIALDPEVELIFKSVSLETETVQGTIEIIPQYKCCDNSIDSIVDNLVINCKEAELFNPYAIGGGAALYSNLSSVVSSIFGHCINFFKTAADQRSRDVMFHEYSLLNVISNKEIKILFPDNILPTREIQFDPIQMDNNIGVIEIHIVKKEFEKWFGLGSRPEEGDYMYIPILKQMYQVQSIANPDDFLYQSSYWRVGLAKYEERASRVFDDESSEILTDSLTSGIQDLDKELEKNLKDISNPLQLYQMGIDDRNKVDRYLNKNLEIKSFELFSNWTLISKFYYDLDSINKGDDALIWNKDIEISDNTSFTLQFLFNPKFDKKSYNLSINSVEDYEGLIKLNLEKSLDENIKIIEVLGVNNLVGQYIVKYHFNDSIVIDAYYDSDVSLETSSSIKTTNFSELISNTNQDFYFYLTDKNFILKIGEESYYNEHKVQFSNNWYGFFLVFSNIFNQLSFYLWNLENVELNNNRSKFVMIYKSTQEIEKISIPASKFTLQKNQLNLTNFRFYDTIIDENLHNTKLLQYLVNKSSNCIIIDNAIPNLRLNASLRYVNKKDIMSDLPESQIIDEDDFLLIDQHGNSIIG